MKSRKFEVLHPNDWKVLKVRQFEYKRGNCDTIGTIIYERPYRAGEYVKETNDVVDVTINKGLTNLFGKLEYKAHEIQCKDEVEDFLQFYCSNKYISELTVRCMPQVVITKDTADPETPIIGYDFNFRIYLDFVDKDSKLSPLLTLSSYEQQFQKIFDKVSAELKEL